MTPPVRAFRPRPRPAPLVRFKLHLMAGDAAALGLSNAELARRTGLSKQRIGLFLRGRNCSNATFAILCHALGKPPSRYLILSEARHETRVTPTKEVS